MPHDLPPHVFNEQELVQCYIAGRLQDLRTRRPDTHVQVVWEAICALQRQEQALPDFLSNIAVS